jgi:hypothetical protein
MHFIASKIRKKKSLNEKVPAVLAGKARISMEEISKRNQVFTSYAQQICEEQEK